MSHFLEKRLDDDGVGHVVLDEQDGEPAERRTQPRQRRVDGDDGARVARFETGGEPEAAALHQFAG